ncbi:MAG TPA: serine hydrolase [Streptosporangiaceae bacterium]|nr:serine hydrolase [Streptosporangiaceae bacterium]
MPADERAGEPGGGRPTTAAAGTTHGGAGARPASVHGWCDPALHRVRAAFGLGFMRPSLTFPTPPAGRDGAFGHTGVGGSIGFADTSRGLALAYVPNRMSDDVSGALRAYRLIEAVYESIG